MSEPDRANEPEPRRSAWLLAASFSVIWVFAVYLAYYSVHKPLTIANVLAMADRVADLAAWMALLLLATAMGHRLLRGLGLSSPTARLTLAAGTGLGLVSLIILGIGLVGALHRGVGYGLAFLGAVMLLPDIKAIARLLRHLERPTLHSPLDKLLMGYLLLVLCLALAASLTPPVAWDSQVYHLTGPKLFMERGKITGEFDIPYLGFPSLLEMLFATGMLLKGDIVAKLVHLTYGVLSAGLLYSFVRRHLRASIPLLAPAIYLSVPSVVLVSTWAYVDLGLAFYTMAAFYAFVSWAESHENRWLVLTGMMSGFALGVKYTAVLTPFVLGGFLIWELKSKRVGDILTRLGLLWLAAAAVACPWYLKNWALTGNPFYPFLFAGRFWDGYRAWWYSRWGTGLVDEPFRLLIAPWELTVMGVEGKAGYEATIGPILLGCLPLLLIGLVWKNGKARHRPIVSYALLLSGAHYLLWLSGVAQSELLRQTRLLFPIFPVLAVLAAVAVERLAAMDAKGFSLQRFVLMAVTGTLLLNSVSFVVSIAAESPAQYLLGLETHQQFLERHLGDYYLAIAYVNGQLPSSSRVLLLWEPRSYYCERECWPDAILDRFMHLRYRYGDAAQIQQHLEEVGVTHVLLNQAGFEHIVAAQFDPILPEDIVTLQTLQEDYWVPMQQFGESYVLYRLR